jgi:hypothetical protein
MVVDYLKECDFKRYCICHAKVSKRRDVTLTQAWKVLHKSAASTLTAHWQQRDCTEALWYERKERQQNHLQRQQNAECISIRTPDDWSGDHEGIGSRHVNGSICGSKPKLEATACKSRNGFATPPLFLRVARRNCCWKVVL